MRARAAISGLKVAISAVGATVVAACGGGSSPTTSVLPPPPAAVACAPSGTVSLSPLQGATLDCSSGTAITVAGNGAVYLVVPQFATGGIDAVAYTTHPYSLNAQGANRSTAAPVARRAGANPGRSIAQRMFDARLRAADRHRSAGASRSLSGARFSPRPAAPPDLGSIRQFQVTASLNGTSFKTSNAALRYIGSNIYVYVDTAAPAQGFTDAQLASFSQLNDQVLFPLILSNFAPPTDIDQNGHVIMLLTPIVNALVTASVCQNQGFVAGFFDGNDLTAGTNSNGGEIFYSIVPDPGGKVSCAHSVATVTTVIPATFLHEVQHMVSFGQHVILHGGNGEEGWLDEGMSIFAEELGSLYYEAKFPPPTGRTRSTQLFPDSAEAFISEQLVDSYDYLSFPDTVSLTLHSDDQGGLAWRAGDWLLMHYVGDQFGAGVYPRLLQTNLTGLANLEAATGIPFPTLFSNFAISLYADSLPGVARASIPSRYHFRTRNLRQMYQALYNAAAGSNGINSPFPILLGALSSTGSVSGSMVPGAVSFYQLATPSGTATVTLKFSTPASASFGTSLHPQVSIFRIQ